MCTEFNGLIAFPLKCFILNLQTNKTAKSLPCNLIFIYNIQSLAIIYKIPSVHSFKLHYFLMGGGRMEGNISISVYTSCFLS